MRQFLLCFVTVLALFSFLMVECYCGPLSSTILGSHVGFSYGDIIDVHEWETSSQLSSYIYNCSSLSSYTTYNWFGSATTRDNIYTAASGAGAVFSITYFYGHGGYDYFVLGSFEPHWYVYACDGSKVYDCDVYPQSNPKNVKFAFLWSCHQGDTIGGTHFWTGVYGMPKAWLHTTDLSNDGYADPDGKSSTFIGFKLDAPYLTKGLGSPNYNDGYYFVAYFYQSAMQSGKTINQALNDAAFKVWGVSYFSQCPLYTGWGEGQMVVYGDGSASLGLATTPPPGPPPPPPIHYVPPPCPTLFVWNGESYVEETVLNIHAETDVTLQHVITQTLVPENGLYQLELKELDNFTSHIDQVKLYAVDQQGRWHLLPLTYAKHNELGMVTRQLLFDDEIRIDLTPTQEIEMRFIQIVSYTKTAYFVFEINGYNRKIE